MSGLIDIGANLTHESFATDLDAVLQRSQRAGVEKIIVTGASLDSSREALQLAQKYPDYLYATAGTHPHYADAYHPEFATEFKDLYHQHKVVAVGETGLDYFRNFSSPQTQRRVFTAHLEMAIEHQLPVFLHQRDAHTDFFSILKEFSNSLSNAVVHCFTGTEKELEDYLQLDCYIGITGWICDERRGKHLIDLAQIIPENRLLVETDAPYLLPRDLKPKPKTRRNEPEYLPHIVQVLATARNQTIQHVIQITVKNTQTFFDLT